jgi:hypothetical protein
VNYRINELERSKTSTQTVLEVKVKHLEMREEATSRQYQWRPSAVQDLEGKKSSWLLR